MRVRVLYFVDAREAVGRTEEWLDLPPDVATVGALRDHLCARGGPWTVLARRGTRFAVNRAVAPGVDAPIHEGDEVAVFSAISGG